MKEIVKCSLPNRGRGRSIRTFIASVAVLLIAGSNVTADVSVHTNESSTTLTPGTVMSIRWSNDLEAANVDVVLWDGIRRTTQVIAERLSEEQTQLVWTVPAGIDDGTRYRILVRDSRQPDRAMSNVGFLTFLRAAPVPTSIDQLGADADRIEVAPVPASERVRIGWSVPMRRIEIVDVHGARVKVLDLLESSRSCSIEIADLSAGTYTVQSLSASGRRTHSPLIIHR